MKVKKKEIRENNKKKRNGKKKKLKDKNSNRKHCVLCDWSLWMEEEGKLFLSQEKLLGLKMLLSQDRTKSQVEYFAR